MAARSDDARRAGPGVRPAFAVPGFEIDDELLDDGTRLIIVRGDLDLATGPVLGQRIRRPLFWQDTTRLVVDLTDVSFIDSSGTRALVLSQAHARALDRDVRFVCPDGNVLRRLHAYGLDLRLAFFQTRADALAA